MEFLSTREVFGDSVALRKIHPNHLEGFKEASLAGKAEPRTFGEVLNDALSNANALQQEVTALSEKMITDPDSVDAHDITIAMAKANAALSITKSVVDKALRAYQEIINVR